jgi:hypothetical protein
MMQRPAVLLIVSTFLVGCQPESSLESRPGQPSQNPNPVSGYQAILKGHIAKGAVLHASVAISGGLSFTGSFDDPLIVLTCADAAKGGTNPPGSSGGARFAVPIPPGSGGDPGAVSGGHTFATDAAAFPYRGPGTYTGSGLNATEMEVDTRPGDQETHIFAFPTSIGTLTVNPDASGSFQFSNLEDPGSVRISGKVTWSCYNPSN